MIRAWCCALLLGWALPGHADGLQDCIRAVAGHPALEAIPMRDCPGLWQQLQSNAWPLTEPELTESLTPAQLQFLRRARQLSGRSIAVDRQELVRLIGEISQPDPSENRHHWWKAFNAWLDRLKSGDYEDQYRWLRSLLEAVIPSQAVARLLLYGSLMLLVLMSLGLVGMELYHAGWLAGFPRGRKTGKPVCPTGSALSLTDPALPAALASLPPRRQMAALLESVIGTLADRDLLPADATLTHRQLIRAAERQPVPLPGLRRLVEIAEPVLYGGKEVSPSMLTAFRQNAQDLLSPARP